MPQARRESVELNGAVKRGLHQGTVSIEEENLPQKALANFSLHLIWPELGQMPTKMTTGEAIDCHGVHPGACTLPLKKMRTSGAA